MLTYKKINQILLNLPNNLPIYLAGHIRADQDSVGSCLALAKFLNANGKNAKVLLNPKDMEVISWFDDLSLICHKIVEADYNFIALDVNEAERLGEFEDYFKTAHVTINVDHHQNNLYEANYTLSKPGISSTCEMIFNIISQSGKEYLTQEICSLLYSGIMADTNCFTRRLSNKTFYVAQKLINSGFSYVDVVKKAFSKRTMYEFKALAKLVNEIKFDGFHYVVVDQRLEEFKHLSHNNLVKSIAEDLRKIEDIDIFLMIIIRDGYITTKTMSNNSECADKIAMQFGGGGHKKEAGFTVNNLTVEQIISKTKRFLKIK